MFSEAEGAEVLAGLRKGSAKLRPQQGQITFHDRKTPTMIKEVGPTFIKQNKDDKKVKFEE